MSIPVAVEFDTAELPTDWTRFTPGPELGVRLALVDWSVLAGRDLVDAMDAARRQVTWTQTRLLEGVAELSRRRHAQDPLGGSETHRRVCGEVSLELTLTTRQAEGLVAMAETVPALPHTWAAMRSGRIDYGRAGVLADTLAGLDKRLASRLDAEFAEVAAGVNTTMLRHRLTRAIKTADPAAHTERTKTARRERRVEVWDNDDDTCDLIGRNLHAVDAHAIANRLTAAARAMKADGDARGIDQIRLDLYRDLLRGLPLPDAVRHLFTRAADGLDCPGRDGPAGPDRVPERRPVGGSTQPDAADEVIAAAERQIAQALAEAADEQLTRLWEQARAQGRLDGLARLVNQAVQAMREALIPIVDTWCRTTIPTGTNPTGTGYRPPVALQRLIQHRHRTCAYPTCNRRSVHCDLDHTQPYDKGGRTCKCNLAPLCRTHHRLFKQHWQWSLIQPWPGLLVWVAPAGTWHIVLPQ